MSIHELTEKFENALRREQMADRDLHTKLANRVVDAGWQVLPHTTALIGGVMQGARDTYWVNPGGEMLHVGHASEHNWRDEGGLIARGPWLQVTPKTIDSARGDWELRAISAEEDRADAQKELAQVKKAINEILGGGDHAE